MKKEWEQHSLLNFPLLNPKTIFTKSYNNLRQINMNDFWDERYSKPDYAYGIDPNEFFKAKLEPLAAGRLLLPAEGEGRNAVFASKLGWNVTAFDSSINAKKKAEALADNEKTSINYIVSDFNSFKAKEGSFDCIALIFVHLPIIQRELVHRKLLTFLKPGGNIILEGFSKKQINANTGGPKNIEMLFSEEDILNDFEGTKNLKVVEKEVDLDEGPFHKGKAFTIRMTAQK